MNHIEIEQLILARDLPKLRQKLKEKVSYEHILQYMIFTIDHNASREIINLLMDKLDEKGRIQLQSDVHKLRKSIYVRMQVLRQISKMLPTEPEAPPYPVADVSPPPYDDYAYMKTPSSRYEPIPSRYGSMPSVIAKAVRELDL